MSVCGREASRLLGENLCLLGLSRAKFGELLRRPAAVFRRPNGRALEACTRFLFGHIFGEARCRQFFRRCWPVVDVGTGREYRRVAGSLLALLEKEGRFPGAGILENSLTSATGDKVVQLLWRLSVLALESCVERDAEALAEAHDGAGEVAAGSRRGFPTSAEVVRCVGARDAAEAERIGVGVAVETDDRAAAVEAGMAALLEAQGVWEATAEQMSAENRALTEREERLRARIAECESQELAAGLRLGPNDDAYVATCNDAWEALTGDSTRKLIEGLSSSLEVLVGGPGGTHKHAISKEDLAGKTAQELLWGWADNLERVGVMLRRACRVEDDETQDRAADGASDGAGATPAVAPPAAAPPPEAAPESAPEAASVPPPAPPLPLLATLASGRGGELKSTIEGQIVVDQARIVRLQEVRDKARQSLVEIEARREKVRMEVEAAEKVEREARQRQEEMEQEAARAKEAVARALEEEGKSRVRAAEAKLLEEKAATRLRAVREREAAAMLVFEALHGRESGSVGHPNESRAPVLASAAGEVRAQGPARASADPTEAAAPLEDGTCATVEAVLANAESPTSVARKTARRALGVERTKGKPMSVRKINKLVVFDEGISHGELEPETPNAKVTVPESAPLTPALADITGATHNAALPAFNAAFPAKAKGWGPARASDAHLHDEPARVAPAEPVDVGVSESPRGEPHTGYASGYCSGSPIKMPLFSRTPSPVKARPAVEGALYLKKIS